MLDANCHETFKEGIERSSCDVFKFLNPDLESHQNVYPHQA